MMEPNAKDTSPLMGQHGVVNEEDDDEEDILFHRQDLADAPLLGDCTDIKRVRAQRRRQVLQIIILGLVFMLGQSAFPIHFDDAADIWHRRNVNITDIVDMCYTWFLVSSFVSCFVSPFPLYLFWFRPIIVTGGLVIMLLVSSHFVPTIYIIFPVYIIGGVFLAPYLVASGACTTSITYKYSALSIDGASRLGMNLSIFNGLFHMFFLAGPLIRGVCELIITSPATTFHSNATYFCGMKHCSNHAFDDGFASTKKLFRTYLEVQALYGSFLILTLLAVVLAAAILYFPHKLRLRRMQEKCVRCMTTSVRIWTPNFALLLPTIIFLGAQQELIYSVVVKTYVRCSTPDAWSTYFRMMISGASLITCFPLAIATAKVGRVKVVLFSLVALTCLLGGLMVWRPHFQVLEPYVLIALLWGIVDGVLQTQISALLGSMCPKDKESAFGNYCAWQIFGMLSVHLLQWFFCVKIVIYITVVIAAFSIAAYITMEIRLKLAEQEQRRQRPGDVSAIRMMELEEASWLPGLDPHAERRKSSLVSKLPGVKDQTVCHEE